MNRKVFLQKIREQAEYVFAPDELQSELFDSEKIQIFFDNYKNIALFAQEYTHIRFSKKNKIVNDYQSVELYINIHDSINISSNNNPAFLIACVNNSSHYDAKLYMTNSEEFYDSKGKKIAENTDEFLSYLLDIQYEYHPPVLEHTYELLKQAGWYPERKTDISNLIRDCEKEGIFLTEIQKNIISEFGGISGYDDDGLYFSIHDEKEDDYFTRPLFDIQPFGKDLIKIGMCLSVIYMYLTPDGLLIFENGRQCGLNIMEGFDVLFRLRNIN